MRDTRITQNPSPLAANAAGPLPPRRLLRLKKQFRVHESDSIRQIGARSYSGIVQKRKSQRDSIRHHEQTAKTNQKPNTKSPLIDPRNRLIDPQMPVRRLAGSSRLYRLSAG
jgi:hypothetical protein